MSAPSEPHHAFFDRIFAVGRAAWPELRVERPNFFDYLSRRFGDGAVAVWPRIAADLYLAHACLAEAPGAVASFQTAHLADLERVTDRFNAAPAFTDEVRQRLVETLFVSAGAEPKIAQFSGRGPLSNWIAISARRIAQRLAKAEARAHRDRIAEIAAELTQADEPDVAYLKARYCAALADAISVAVSELDARERAMLQLNALEQVSMDRIAVMYQVSQPTISRWLHRSRERILCSVRRVLRDKYHIVEDDEFDSLLCLVHSQVEVNLASGGGLHT